MPLTTKLNVGLDADYTSPLDLVTSDSHLAYTRQIALASGTGANQADKVWSDNRTLAASASEDIDLAGSLTDAFGATLTFARIKGMLVSASSANTNDVVIGGAASNGFINWVGDATDKIVVKPGGLFVLFAPAATAYAVTASTGDLLHVANSSSGSSVTYDIVLVGASA